MYKTILLRVSELNVYSMKIITTIWTTHVLLQQSYSVLSFSQKLKIALQICSSVEAKMWKNWTESSHSFSRFTKKAQFKLNEFEKRENRLGKDLLEVNHVTIQKILIEK